MELVTPEEAKQLDLESEDSDNRQPVMKFEEAGSKKTKNLTVENPVYMKVQSVSMNSFHNLSPDRILEIQARNAEKEKKEHILDLTNGIETEEELPTIKTDIQN